MYKFVVEKYPGNKFDILERTELFRFGERVWKRHIFSTEALQQKFLGRNINKGVAVYRSNNFGECVQYIQDVAGNQWNEDK